MFHEILLVVWFMGHPPMIATVPNEQTCKEALSEANKINGTMSNTQDMLYGYCARVERPSENA